MIGETLARYKILSKLGAGGIGEVYLGEAAELFRRSDPVIWESIIDTLSRAVVSRSPTATPGSTGPSP